MNKRPIPVTIIAWLFIVMCAVGIIYHLPEFDPRHPLDYGLVFLIRLLGLLGGLFLLRGRSWARWALLLWLACHVVIGMYHSAGQAIMHAIFLAVIGHLLFRAQTTAWLNLRKAPAPKARPAAS